MDEARDEASRMTPQKWDDVLAFKRQRIAHDQRELAEAVEQACPGEHNPVQHRDRRPPWCEACSRDAEGRRVT